LTRHNAARAAAVMMNVEVVSDRTMRSRIGLPVVCAVLATIIVLLAGCAELLPKSNVQTDAQWATFDQARSTIEAIKPYRTTKADLAAVGVSESNPAVTLLSHAEVAVRFPIGGVLTAEDVDPGILDCLRAGKGCNGYQLNVRRLSNDRVGNFWLDSFRFRRETQSTGWTFTALILFVEDRAVYAVYGGQPNVHETQVDRNPLGPLQGWGDWAAGAIYR
jgi:hypothetical protein